MIAPLSAPIQTRMGTSGSGATGVGSAPTGTVLSSFQVKLGEGLDKSTDARNLKLW